MVYLVCGAIPTSVRSFAASMLQQSVMLGASVSQLLYLSFPVAKHAPLYDRLEQQETEGRLQILCYR